MKFKHQHSTYVTGSVKGFADSDSEEFKTRKYYYIKVRVSGKVFYVGGDGALTDAKHAAEFSENDAKKAHNRLRDKYNDVSIFSSTVKLNSI